MTFYRLRSLLLIAVCGLSALQAKADDTSNSLLQTDKPYYFFNEAAGKYLTISNGTPALSTTAEAVTLSQSTGDVSTSSYSLSIGNTYLTTAFQGGVTTSNVSGKWILKPVTGKDGIYTISCRDYNAETTDFLYWSSMRGELATQYAEPSLGGEWRIDAQQCIVLDEQSTNYTKPTIDEDKSATVRLIRKLTIGSWNTLCLPFAVSVEKLKEQWGDDTEVVEFSSLEGTTLHFKNVNTMLEAGHPYLVRPTKQPTGSYYEFDGITTFATTVTECNKSSVAFKGSFVKTTAPNRAYVISQNKLYHLVSDMEMKGFRGYLWQTNANGAPLSF